MRVRLKADGRLVEVTPEGERPLSPDQESARRGLSPNPPLSAASPARDAARAVPWLRARR